MSDNINISRITIPEPTLRRLPWYLAYVTLMRSKNVDYVSSTAIAKAINVDPSQAAKDLSFLNIKGKTRIGYEVALLEKELTDFLGFSRHHYAVMIGAGSLGGALIADSGLSRYGLDIVAGFDIDPNIVNSTIGSVPIFHISELPVRLKAYKAEIGIIAVPVENAQEVANMAVEAGARALWNFTPARLRTNDQTVIENTSIYAHLAVMYNRMQLQKVMSE